MTISHSGFLFLGHPVYSMEYLSDDVIDIRKRIFLVKYDLSGLCYAKCAKNCNDIVRYTVSVFLV